VRFHPTPPIPSSPTLPSTPTTKLTEVLLPMGSTSDDFKSFVGHDYKKEIELKITRISSRLGLIIDEVKVVEDEVFHIYNYLEGTDVRKLTDTKPGEITPADLFWERTTTTKKKNSRRNDDE
jgi:hypothetical protein